MRIIKAILIGSISLFILIFLIVFSWYQTLETRKQAEQWFSLSKYYRQGNLRRQWLMEQAIKTDPSFAEAYMQQSISHNKRGDFSTGMALLEKAVELKPVRYLGYRGSVKLYMLHDYEGALHDFLRLDSLTPNFRDAPRGEDIYQVMSLCHEGLGNDSLALFYLNKAIDEEDPQWVDNQAYLYRSRVQIRLGDFERAMDNLTHGITTNPLADYYYYLAYAHFQLNNPQKGCEYLSEGVEQFNLGYFRSNPYYELPGQVYLSDFHELQKQYCEK
ncbi:MAG: hypothetical protein AAGA66_06970 [Bacteroidota bacterium]